MKKNFYKKITNKFIVAFIGFISIFLHVWLCVLLDQIVQKTIPLNLNFYCIIIIIVICLQNVYKLYYSIFYKDLTKFDYHVIILDNIINSLIPKLFITIIIKYKCYILKNNLYFYLLFNFIPKLLILILFILDIFYFTNISNVYKALLLVFVILFYNYFIYTLKKEFESIKHFLDLNCYIIITSINDDSKNYFVDPCLLVSNDEGFFDSYYFLNAQATSLIWENDLYDFAFIETYEAREEYANKKNIKIAPIHIMVENFDDISKKLSKQFYIEAEKAIYYLAFLYIKEDFTYKYIRKLNIIILTGYLICWLYILIVSFPTIENLKVLLLIKDLIEPFSGNDL